jgi:hypothetical protein
MAGSRSPTRPRGVLPGCALLAASFLTAGLFTHQRLLTAAGVACTGVVLLLLLFPLLLLLLPGPPRPGPQPLVLSTPCITNLEVARAALSAIGLELGGKNADGSPTTELDLVQTVALELDHYDVLTGIERLKKATGDLLITADLLPLRYNTELRGIDALPFLNSRLDLTKGAFYYTAEEDFRTVLFLQPAQVQALSQRGWSFRTPASGRENVA